MGRMPFFGSPGKIRKTLEDNFKTHENCYNHNEGKSLAGLFAGRVEK